MKVFLDACMIIYWVEMANPFYSEFIKFLAKITVEYPKTEIIVSRLSILECLVKPAQKQDIQLINLYKDFFNNPGLTITEINQDIVSAAINIRATTKLKTPDAIQAASALSLGGKHLFLSSDKAFQQVDGLNLRSIKAYVQ